MRKNILIVATSHAHLGNSTQATGLWAEELAVPYYAFTAAGLHVDIASPQGGVVPLDPGSIKPIGQNNAAVERMLADPVLQQALRTTHQTAAINASIYNAVFFPGGHGAMWDLPQDPGVAHIVEAIHAAGRWIASVCHGAAGLVSARRPDGQPVVAGQRINAFTDAEEAAAGLTDAMPFLLESRLRSLGARFEGGPNWLPYAVQDGPFITGQNPQSSQRVAELLVHALHFDDRTIAPRQAA